MKGRWVPHDVRDDVVDFIGKWHQKTEVAEKQFYGWLGLGKSKFADWKTRYGKVNEHNAQVPRDHWITEEEQQRILDYQEAHPLEGYRRLAYMMMDENVVAVSPTSVWRVLKRASRLGRAGQPSKKGIGFEQPEGPHQHWHVDISYINVAGTFYYLCATIDGYSRYIVGWDIRDSMVSGETQLVVERGREAFPEASPRIISDNGPQFVAREFKEYVRVTGMSHVRTSPYYPQSNGKIERFHRTLKADAIRRQTPLSLADARRVVRRFVNYYNHRRLHSAVGYVTPADVLRGRAEEIHAERDRKLDEARQQRAEWRDLLRRLPGAPAPARPAPSPPATMLTVAPSGP